jgi:hypothetical protein
VLTYEKLVAQMMKAMIKMAHSAQRLLLALQLHDQILLIKDCLE